MPNHVTNKLIVTGPDDALARFKLNVAIAAENGTVQPFSFHAVIPMPEVLQGTISGSGIAEAIWLVSPEKYAEIGRAQWFAGRGPETEILERLARTAGISQFETRDAALAWFSANRPEKIEVGRKHIAAFERTGHVDWYSWSVENWGTKWDAYMVSLEESPGRLEYQFDTAWSLPMPVILKLVKEFPQLDFEHRYFDEMHEFWGIETYKNGECVSVRESEVNDERDLCMELKGYDPDEDEDDDVAPS
jgi:hypothetical protein